MGSWGITMRLCMESHFSDGIAPFRFAGADLDQRRRSTLSSD